MCGKCVNFAYPSQSGNAPNSFAQRAERVGAKLQWVGRTLDDAGDRPLGMHRKMYDRRLRRYAEDVELFKRTLVSRNFPD